MARFVATVKRVGGSLMALIPKDIAEKEQLLEGDRIDLAVKKLRPSYLGAFPTSKPWSKKEDRMRSKYE